MTDSETQASVLRVLVVDDEEDLRASLSRCLEADGHGVTSASSSAQALAHAAQRAFDLVFVDLLLGDESGLDLIQRLLAESPWANVVMCTADASIATAVEAIKRGASDYLHKPISPPRIRQITSKCAEQRQVRRRIEAIQSQPGDDPDDELPAASAAMRRVLELARRVAPSNATLLIHGEAGVGKTRLAQFIHRHSGRPAAAYGVACCQNATASDLEVELFGLSPGESPDAATERNGRVAFCEGGTLTLCEVGDLPAVLQPRLLRLLQDKEYERQNDFVPRRADVRVIATASTDLYAAVERGSFRSELLLAVDVVSLEIPPLRSRPDDIRLLAERYLGYFARQNARPISGIDADAMEALVHHRYPGNARELRNLIERAVLLCNGDALRCEHFPFNLMNGSVHVVGDLVPLETITGQHIRRVLAATQSLEAAAAVLGINPSTLWRRRKRYGF